MSTEHLIGDVGLILDALMGTADEPRREAEAHLRKLTVKQPAEILLVLAQVGALAVGGFQLDHRFLTLVLLKRLAFRPLSGLFLNEQSQIATAPFDVVAERTRGRIETVLVAGLRDELNVRMRKGLGNCAAGWAQQSAVRHRPFMALPPVLLELTASAHPFHRFTPFQLMNLTPTLLVDSVSEPIPVGQLAQILLRGLNDPSVDVQIEAMKAVRSIILESFTGKEREQVGWHLVLEAFKTLSKLPSDLLSHSLVSLVDIATHCPHLFMPTLIHTLPYLLSVLSPPNCSLPDHPFSQYPPSKMLYSDWEDVANPATEIMLSLAELRTAQISKWEDGRVAREMVGLQLGRLVAGLEDQGEECTDWLEDTNIDEQIESYPLFPEEVLCRMANCMSSETIIISLSEHVTPLLTLKDWRCRYSAFIAIGCVAQGCFDNFKNQIRDVFQLVLLSATDQHPRVRYASLQCLAQLCESCKGIIQSEYGEKTLNLCLHLLSDPAARVRAHAATCIARFFKSAGQQSFAAFLDPLVRGLLQAFQAGPIYVQEQILYTLSVVATQADHAFAPFYAQCMVFLIPLLEAPTDRAHRKLVGRIMECVTLTGYAVGKPIFAADAVRVARLLIRTQNDITSIDDPRNSFLVEAWSNVCRALGQDFAPFLSHVIPPLLKAGSYTPSPSELTAQNLRVTDADEDVHDALATAHTTEIDEKFLAFDHLTIYAFQMRAAFEPWLMPCMKLALEGLTFPYSDQVKESAAFLVPALLQVAKDARSWSAGSDALEHVFANLINAMSTADDFGYLGLLYKSFADSLHVIAAPLPFHLTTRTFRLTSGHLLDLLGRREHRQQHVPYMDPGDREIYLEEQGEEDSCLDNIFSAMDMIGQLGVEGGDVDGELRAGMEMVLKQIGQVRAQAMAGEEGE